MEFMMKSTTAISLLCCVGCLCLFLKLHTFFMQYSSSYPFYILSSSFSAFLFPPVSLPLSCCRHSINQVIESIMRRWAGPRALDWVLWGPDLTVGAADPPFYNHNSQSGHRTNYPLIFEKCLKWWACYQLRQP